jgi:hypothetical protein
MPRGFALPPWPAWLLVGVAAVVPFLSTLNTYFTGDDFGLIQLFSSKPPLHFLSLFFTPWTELTYGQIADELRPLIALSYQVDSVWGAATPVGYHLTNIVFHVANALIVLVIARGICRLTTFASAFAGVLFAVLPVHAPSVAWISGRADSIPALFYLSAFLCFAIWRRGGCRRFYVASVALSFLALFSKQSAITFVLTIALFDLLVERRIPRWSWAWVQPYVAFLAITLLYLGLRLVLFGNAVREQSVNEWMFASFGLLQVVNFGLLALGWHAGNQDLATFVGPDVLSLVIIGDAVTLWALLGLFAEARKVLRRMPAGRSRYIWFFGPAWWLLGVAPLLVTYVSPRHLYLVAAGASIVVAIGIDALWGSNRQLRRSISVLASAALIAIYASQQKIEVDFVNKSGTVSAQAVRGVEAEARAAAPGSLLVLNTPGQWAWGMPYVLRPPFIDASATRDLFIVSNREAYCCQLEWEADTRDAVKRWADDGNAASVIVLGWDAAGNLERRSSADDPMLVSGVRDLFAAKSAQELDQGVKNLLPSTTLRP